VKASVGDEPHAPMVVVWRGGQGAGGLVTVIKAYYSMILVLMAGTTAYGQNNLPACQGIDTGRWNICFRSWTSLRSDKFVGEFKDDTHHGKGTYLFSNWPSMQKKLDCFYKVVIQ
jgi:hypothetical protein